MVIKPCSICGRPAITGGLCYRHGAAYYSFNESQRWEQEEKKNEKQGRDT